MRNRNDFIQQLRQNEKFKHALASARTDAERKAIASTVEAFVGSFADVLGPLIERAEQDSIFAQQLGQAINEGRNVVSTSDPAASGSTG